MPEDPYVEAALQAPPSPDYVPGPEEPKQAPPSPDYIPGPEHTDDEIVDEDQPGAKDASPTAQSPDYVPESDPEANPEEDDDEDPEEDPVDGGDDGDDEEGLSEDDDDDDMDIEADDDEEEEEEHLAPADSVVVALPATDQAPSAKETEPFETEVSRLLAISTPPSSPLSPWSSPLPQIPSPSLPLSPPLPLRPHLLPILYYYHHPSYSPPRPDAPLLGIPPPLPISVPTSSQPLLLPSASRREDKPEVTLPPRKRLDIALGPGYEVGESSSAAARPAGGLRADYGFVATMDREIRRDPERKVGYGITDSWDEIVETLQGAPVSTDTEFGRHMTAFETRVRQDTDEVYTRLDDEQSQRQLLMSEIRELHDADRRRKAVISKMLKADQRRSADIRELRTANHTRQQQLIQTLTVMQSLLREVTPLLGQVTTLQGHVTALQGQVIALQGQVTVLQGQQGLAGGPAQPELPEEAALHGQVVALQDMSQPTRVSTVLTGTAGPSWSPARQSIQRSLAVQRRSFNGYHFVYSLLSITGLISASKALENGTKTSHKAMIDQGVTAALAAEIKQEVAMTCHTSETGTEGVVELIQWFERMEIVFRISNCPVENQVKFSTCTLLAGALTWWNSHVMTVSHDATYAMTWADLRKKEVLTSIESKE
ncbi:hypothetical protein Tco_0618541 [Tanacetum coccineum]